MNVNKLGNYGCDAPVAFAAGRNPASVSGGGFSSGNRLLAALSSEVLSSLLPHLKAELLPRGEVLCDLDEPLRRVYFLESGLVSLITVFEDGATAEMATVGREGLIGIGALLGGEMAFGRYVVSMPGQALGVEVSQFRRALQESSGLRVACEAYAQAFLQEALQTAACNSVHMVEERCARWLLMSHDRSDGDSFALTQGCLADMLGVCRSTVTAAAGTLQRAGLIRYRRGAIRVLDRPRLETAACECYHVIRNQYERLLPRTYERQPCERQQSLVGEPRLARAFG